LFIFVLRFFFTEDIFTSQIQGKYTEFAGLKSILKLFLDVKNYLPGVNAEKASSFSGDEDDSLIKLLNFANFLRNANSTSPTLP